ncbi:hypothetical protein OE165_27955, partial [Escherichia coli]|uniref:hypothetical protein n=1 Tax=Escherichia coli TaxID=562 RepID=UPI0021F317A0
PTEARGPELEKILKGAYPTLWAPGFNLKAATASQFNDHLRDQFGISGSTIDKAANFFMAIADQAGVEVSPHIKRRTPVAGSSA